MSAGKRLSKNEPLTEHDIAERLDKAALRLLRILMDVRQTEGLFEVVRTSRYHTNVLDLLDEELAHWVRRPKAYVIEHRFLPDEDVDFCVIDVPEPGDPEYTMQCGRPRKEHER